MWGFDLKMKRYFHKCILTYLWESSCDSPYGLPVIVFEVRRKKTGICVPLLYSAGCSGCHTANPECLSLIPLFVIEGAHVHFSLTTWRLTAIAHVTGAPQLSPLCKWTWPNPSQSHGRWGCDLLSPCWLKRTQLCSRGQMELSLIALNTPLRTGGAGEAKHAQSLLVRISHVRVLLVKKEICH